MSDPSGVDHPESQTYEDDGPVAQDQAPGTPVEASGPQPDADGPEPEDGTPSKKARILSQVGAATAAAVATGAAIAKGKGVDAASSGMDVLGAAIGDKGGDTAQAVMAVARPAAIGVGAAAQGLDDQNAASKVLEASAPILEDFADWGAGNRLGKPLGKVLRATSKALASDRSRGERSLVEQALDLLRGDRHASVKFEVEFQDDVGAEWEVHTLKSGEKLGETYALTLKLSTETEGADPQLLLGTSATVSVERGEARREVSGVVSSVRSQTEANDLHVVHVEVVPAFALLEQSKRTRIFQGKRVPEILDEVLSEGLSAYQREHRLSLEREYPVCEYRTQYEESDHDFCMRLMAEAGIATFFEQEGGAEVLVLTDDNGAFLDMETEDGGPLTVSAFEAGQDGHEGLRRFELTSRLTPTTLSMRHYDWTWPKQMFESAVDGTEEEENALDGSLLGPKREHEEHDGRPLTFSGYDEDGARANQEDDGAAQLRVRRAQQRLGARVARGESNVVHLEAGRVFELSGHRYPELDGRWLVIAVEHQGDPKADGDRYLNTFEAIPLEVPFVLEPRPRPRVHAMQTARVVGAPGDEIHTDSHGRVRVQFHWDRQGQDDDHASCFLRVMQPWAGPEWGFVFLPRVGMEVVVSFLHGDPDQPLVIGSLYHGAHAPPYLVDGEKTKSFIRTKSTPSGGPDDYNELRFEDEAGEEEVYIQAQKNLTELVKNDHATTVKGSQTNSVSGGHSESVGGDQSLSVKKNRTHTVEGDEEVKVQGKRETTVIGEEKHTVGSQQETVIGESRSEYKNQRDVVITKGAFNELVLAGNRWSDVTGQFSMTSTETLIVQQNGDHRLKLDNTAILTSSESFAVSAGAVTVKGDKSGALELEAPQSITLTCGGASITLNSDGSIELVGSLAVSMSVGANMVEAGTSGVAIAGATVDVSGNSMVNVMGSVVKIN